MRARTILFVAISFVCASAYAEYARSKAALRAFVKIHACPSTGEHRLPCPGWQMDHIIPLKCSGPDEPANLQWLTIEDHKLKTKAEAKYCRK